MYSFQADLTMNKKELKDLRWNTLLKCQLIEIVSLWEGRLTTNVLISAFGIGRQQASRDINFYNKQIAPNNLIYDMQLKGHRPTDQFEPVLTKGTIDEYFNLLGSRKELGSHLACLNLTNTNTEMISSPGRFIVPEFIRPVIAAVKDNMRLEIEYLSLSSQEKEYRVISPHTLVYSGYRWHIRAHCEKNNDYRDFVLSRISTIPEPVLPSEHTARDDPAWNRFIELIIKPDNRLSSFQQEVIARDFNMVNNQLTIPTRAALANYYLQYLRITPYQQKQSPEAQQLVLANMEQIKQWLF